MRRLLAAAFVAAVGILGTPSAALAVCSDYSESCETPASVLPTTLEREAVSPTTLERGSVAPADSSTTARPATLPFTGGELVLIGFAAAGALGTGAALVLGGRRTLPEVPSSRS